MRNIFLKTLLVILFILPYSVQAEPGKAIKIKSKPIDAFLQSKKEQVQFGKLEFLGGLELTSNDDSFGGISGIRMLDSSRFIAITDKGKWLTGEIIRDGDKPNAIENARMARLRDASGKKMSGKRRADSEGIEVSDDNFIISFERNHRAELFAFKKDRLRSASKKPLFELNDVGLESNKGPEGIAKAPETSPLVDSILAFPENAFNGEGNLRVFIFNDEGRQELAIKPSGGFSLTDAAFLPNGDLLVLERRYSLFSGLGMRLRRFDAANVKPGAILEGTQLIDASGRFEIDNMEGLALSTMLDGSTRITIISDDNFSNDQRTVLVEFRLRN